MLFGDFIRKKRLEQNIEAKEVCRLLGVSQPYFVDIEKNRRNPPDEEVINKLSEILHLSKEEMHCMLDLAGKARNNVSHDISKYVLEEEMARVALRTAKENNLGKEFWIKVNEMAKKVVEKNDEDK